MRISSFIGDASFTALMSCACKYHPFAGIEIPKYVDTVTPEYKPKFDALVR